MSLLKTYEIKKGINIRLLKAEKFKTNSISLYIHLPLMRDTVTKAALLPNVLKRGTAKYPTLTQLSKRTEELYGATVALGTSKFGDAEAIKITLKFISDSFISENIASQMVDLLRGVVLCPKIQNGAFDENWVNQEKENLKNFILGLKNDKKEYAKERCNEIMFEGDPFGISKIGYVEDLEEIDAQNLYEFYVNILKTSVIDIFVGGSFNEEEMVNELKDAFSELNERDAEYQKTSLAMVEKDITVKKITEEVSASQSKLSIGFNCGILPTSKEYYDMMVFNCIFGGSPFSKLFNNVREKLSLAYYVFSLSNRQKGYMQISAGIEGDKFDAAYGEIMVQLEKMRQGDFSDEETASAKKYLETSLMSTKDSLDATEQFYMSHIMMNSNETIDILIENLAKVKREDIVRAAKRVQQDTVYFLKGVLYNEIQ